MDNYDEGISLLDIIKVALGRKLVLLITTLATMVLGTILILFVYNKQKQVYYSTFSYSDPVLVEGNYVDGSIFNYQSIITEESLNSVKDSDSSFKSIDINEIFEKNGISIAVNTVYGNDGKEVLSQTYTITANKKFFSSNKQAKKFVAAVANAAVNKNIDLASKVGATANLDNFGSSNRFELKAQILVDQLELLDEKYEALIENYGDVVVSKTGKTLSAYQEDIKLYSKEHSIDALEYEVYDNIYLMPGIDETKTYSSLYTYYSGLYSYNEQKINSLQAKIDALIAAANNLQTLELQNYNALIAEYTIENIEYARNMKFIANALGMISSTDPNYVAKAGAEANSAFKIKIDGYYDEIAELTAEYSEVVKDVISQSNNVYFNNTSVIKTTGGINAIIAVVLTAVVGFAAACVVNLCLDYKKLGNNTSNKMCACEANTDNNTEENKED